MGNQNSGNRTHKKRGPGRPYPANYQRMARVCISLTPAQIKWLHRLPRLSRARTIRAMFDQAMKSPKVPRYRIVEQRF